MYGGRQDRGPITSRPLMTAHRLTREAALGALQAAAADLAIETVDLTAEQYRAFRASGRHYAPVPSDLSVCLLFGSWRRACQLASHSNPALAYGQRSLSSRAAGSLRAGSSRTA